MSSGTDYFVVLTANLEFTVYWDFIIYLFQALINSVKIVFRLTLFAVILE